MSFISSFDAPANCGLGNTTGGGVPPWLSDLLGRALLFAGTAVAAYFVAKEFNISLSNKDSVQKVKDTFKSSLENTYIK